MRLFLVLCPVVRNPPELFVRPLKFSRPTPWETPKFSRDELFKFKWDAVWFSDNLDWLPCAC